MKLECEYSIHLRCIYTEYQDIFMKLRGFKVYLQLWEKYTVLLF